MKKYLKLMRVHHYLKNGLILLPLIFSGGVINAQLALKTLIGFLVFSLASSAIYIFNDLADVETDRKHIIKCKRPIATGEVSIQKAKTFMILLLLISFILNYFISDKNNSTWLLLITYILLNLMYSKGLKNIPLVDITILVSGYLLRVLYGSDILDIQISSWLYLTVISMSFYLGLGKRRNEIIKDKDHTRKVLEYYNHNFLDKNMYMTLALTIVFYALWCVDPETIARHSNDNIIWTVPLVMLICMKYSLNIEGNCYGDPVDVLLNDRVLIILVIIYGFITVSIIYLKPVIDMLSGFAQ